ncbi:hypothetical protein ZWY2020_054299 [Hordeum vulgare]|nr:hypothetical protein ZWY2020_054299 [Hordeum vulgare]
MAPDSYLLLHESISAHRVPSLHCHHSTKEAAHWSLNPVYASKYDAPKEETTPTGSATSKWYHHHYLCSACATVLHPLYVNVESITPDHHVVATSFTLVSAMVASIASFFSWAASSCRASSSWGPPTCQASLFGDPTWGIHCVGTVSSKTRARDWKTKYVGDLSDIVSFQEGSVIDLTSTPPSGLWAPPRNSSAPHPTTMAGRGHLSNDCYRERDSVNLHW